MPDYHALYLKLFAAQADAVDSMKAITDQMIRVHQEAEEAVLSSPETKITLLAPEPDDSE